MIRRIILSFVTVLFCCNAIASEPGVILEKRPSLPLPVGGSPLLALFDDDKQKGEIQVSAPKGHPLPYKYLISYEPLPDLDSIWTTIKDSVPIDSVTFFAGNEVSTNYLFKNLEPEHYYVAVYDNNGIKIMEDDAIVSPKIELLDLSNIDSTGGTFSQSAAPMGNALIDGFLGPLDNGGVEFKVTETGGNFLFGFNNFGESKPTGTSDFEYGFEVFPDNTFGVFKSGTMLFSDTLNLNDVLRIYKRNNEMIFCHNEFEIHRTPMGVANNLTGALLFNTPLGSLSNGIKLGDFKSGIHPLTTIMFQLECGDELGHVKTVVSDPEFYGGTGTFVLRDAVTGAIISSGDISILFSGIDLASGEYKIEYNYFVDGMGHYWSDYFSLGYRVFWNILNPYFTPIEETVNTIHASGSLDYGHALSQNVLNYDEEGWVSFHTHLVRYYPDPDDIFLPASTSNAKIKIVNQDLETKVEVNVFNYGLEILNKYIWVTGEEADIFTTYSDGPIKIKRTEDPTWKYEVSFQDNPIPFSTVDEIEPDIEAAFSIKAEGRNANIYDTYASFCGFENVRSYADLTKKLDGGYYIAQNGIVKFIYNEEYNDQDAQLTYKIFDANNEVAVNEIDLAQTVVYGDNRYHLDFSTFTGDVVLENGVYILEVKNEKNEKQYLRFKIINN